MVRQRIFISYRRNVEPDQSLARRIYRALAPDYEVFIDQKLPPAESWETAIDTALAECDLFIVLLSSESVASPMVGEEVRTIGRRRRDTGHPRLAPIRLGFRGELPYELRAIVNPVNWLDWESSVDTEALLTTLRQLAAGQPVDSQGRPSSPSAHPEPPGPSAAPTAIFLQNHWRVDQVVQTAGPVVLKSPRRDSETDD